MSKKEIRFVDVVTTNHVVRLNIDVPVTCIHWLRDRLAKEAEWKSGLPEMQEFMDREHARFWVDLCKKFDDEPEYDSFTVFK